MEKRNYNQEMERITATFSEGSKPSLLLQCCCGPCSTAVIERLCDSFILTLFYYNPNTWPEEEYFKRLDTLKEFLVKSNQSFVLIASDYHPSEFFEAIKGYEDMNEGSARCEKCIGLRLRHTAEYAKANGFDYFASTLSVSPKKNADTINALGEALEKELGVKYLVNDFKKGDGYKRSVELSDKYGLYRQNYCGCEASKNREK